jgi:hypothetical protein
MDDLKAHTYTLLELLEEEGMSSDTSLMIPSPYQPADLPSTSTAIIPLPQPPISHSTWIFQESCRRTYLACFIFIAIYRIATSSTCHSRAEAVSVARPWTFSAPLWKASSEFEFKIAWKDHLHFVIRNLDLGEVLRNGDFKRDVDEFGKICLVLAWGVDGIRQWAYEKSGEMISL